MDKVSIESSLTWYRTALDIAALLVALGLIGEYWTSFIKLIRAVVAKPINWLDIWASFKVIFFPLLVVGGVATELWVQVHVSTLEGNLQVTLDNENASLFRRLAPRNLTDDQQSQIAKRLKSLGPKSYSMSMQANLEPGSNLRTQLTNSLRSAGWTFKPLVSTQPNGSFMHHPQYPDLGMVIGGLFGIRVLFDGQQADLSDASDALCDELNKAEIVCVDAAMLPAEAGMYEKSVIQVAIGAKP